MDKTTLGMGLMGLGALELLVLSAVATIKQKPVLVLGAIVSGTATGAVGLLVYLGKIL